MPVGADNRHNRSGLPSVTPDFRLSASSNQYRARTDLPFNATSCRINKAFSPRVEQGRRFIVDSAFFYGVIEGWAQLRQLKFSVLRTERFLHASKCNAILLLSELLVCHSLNLG